MFTIIWKFIFYFPNLQTQKPESNLSAFFSYNFHEFSVEKENLIEKENVYHTWLWLFLLLKLNIFLPFSKHFQFSNDISKHKRKTQRVYQRNSLNKYLIKCFSIT